MRSVSGNIKGAALREALVWLEGRLPASKMERLAEVGRAHGLECNRDLPAIGILSNRWYEASAIHALCDELVEGLSRTEARDLAYEASVGALEHSFNRFLRFVLKRMGSPQLHPRFAQRLWGWHFDTGTITVELIDPKKSIVRFGADWTSHHPFICDMSTASDKVIYGAIGLSNVQCKQLSCVSHGGSHCSHSVSWD